MMTRTAHATIVIERTYDAAPVRVFAAFADPVARAEWAVPAEPIVLVYDQADFRIGGIDVSRCGPKHDLMFRAETLYLDIVDGARIVSVETVSKHGTRLSVSLVTAEIRPEGTGARVVLTDQIVALDDPDILKGHEQGYSGALDNLTCWLSRQETAWPGLAKRPKLRTRNRPRRVAFLPVAPMLGRQVGVRPWRRVPPGEDI
jgi:uncharacterized protein YndB with AHSA1/START domain